MLLYLEGNEHVKRDFRKETSNGKSASFLWRLDQAKVSHAPSSSTDVLQCEVFDLVNVNG